MDTPTIFQKLATSFVSVVDFAGDVVDWVFSSPIQPFIFIGVSMGVIFFAIRTIKSLAWGF